MSKYTAEYKTFFESPAGLEFLTFIHNQLDTEHEGGEKAEDEITAFGHGKTAKAYRDIEEHITSMMLERKTLPQ